MLRIIDPALIGLHVYWLAKRGLRLAPSRADMRPQEIGLLLPHVYIVDIIGRPRRFRFRLVGTRIIEGYGEEITGKFLDEIDLGDKSSAIQEEYEKAVNQQAPTASSWSFSKNDGRELNYEHLILPLSTDGRTINMLFGGASIKGFGPLLSPQSA